MNQKLYTNYYKMHLCMSLFVNYTVMKSNPISKVFVIISIQKKCYCGGRSIGMRIPLSLRNLIHSNKNSNQYFVDYL